MGFPRIISKNNKIYTKLGEFCLSGDGQQFWIVCHTCQEELQTQDNFWKHIQDEHNFMHGIKQVSWYLGGHSGQMVLHVLVGGINAPFLSLCVCWGFF